MKFPITILFSLCSFTSWGGLTFEGLNSKVIEIKPDANTGLEAIYVLENTQDVRISYTSSGGNVQWSRFSSQGGGYAQEIPFSVSGNLSSIDLQTGDMGYIVTENERQHCFWIIDYSQHEMSLQAVSPDIEESDCAMIMLKIDGSAPRIQYYTINGAPRELSREIELKYYTLEWDSDSHAYAQVPVTKTFSSFSNSLTSASPLCNTDFELTGDRFLKEWGRELTCTSTTYDAIAIDAQVEASQISRDNDNEIKDSASELGGSAPAEITFTGFTTDGVAFREWQMSRDRNFDIIDLRFNEDQLTYTFREQGTTYVRFMVANNTGDCDWISETYEVNIGESRLECPNAFSPGASEGVNDEWKVSYKSLVSFECHIFNRWGNELFSTTDPSAGWDGKYKGKLVPAGVYFYVIKAKGADGKTYNRSGDINIINYNKNINQSNPIE
ncbi:MAG: gliding motility-associated C-terminal domain-containing protein [Muribaculaceae bacterium]|nr:gliding motility-associated C-terminal domain-containing protein [Muribaculaceae bacterium]